MKQTIWYGAKDNDVRFAENKSDLTSQGINDPRSFQVDGNVTGLELSHQQTAQSGSQQTA